MNILESLENLQVSEECLNDIMDIVERILNETDERKKIDTYKARATNLDNSVKKAKQLLRKGMYGAASRASQIADNNQIKLVKNKLLTQKHDKTFKQDAYNKAEEEIVKGI